MAFIKPTGRSEFTRTALEAAEHVTATPALALLRQSKLLPTPAPGTTLLDNASGGSILTAQLLTHASPAPPDLRITCADLDLTVIDFLQARARTENWANVTVQHADAHQTSFADAQFSHVLMNFGPQLMRDPELMLRETLRVLRAGGTLGFTAWVVPGFGPSLKAVFPDFEPGTPLGGGLAEEGYIVKVLRGLGVEGVEVRECEFVTEGGVDGYLELFVGFLMKGFFEKVGELKTKKYEEYMRGPGRKGDAYEA